MSSLGFYVVVGVAVFIRTLVSKLPANRNRGVDVGDVLLGAILASTWLATGRNPFAVAGISGSHLNRNVVCASVAATLMLAGANRVVHKCILTRHSGWRARRASTRRRFRRCLDVAVRMALLAGWPTRHPELSLRSLSSAGC